MRPGGSVGYVRATRTSLPRWVRTGRTGRLAPRAPRTVRTGYAYQPRALGTYSVPWQPRWSDGLGLVFAASTITGLATTITTSPATNARTLIMTSPPGTYSGMLGCIGAILALNPNPNPTLTPNPTA